MGVARSLFFIVLEGQSPGEPFRQDLNSVFSLEEVILAEDETDVEQRHPFDGNCSEPSMKAGPRGVGLCN